MTYRNSANVNTAAMPALVAISFAGSHRGVGYIELTGY
jgi:hypothetical protein